MARSGRRAMRRRVGKEAQSNKRWTAQRRPTSLREKAGPAMRIRSKGRRSVMGSSVRSFEEGDPSREPRPRFIRAQAVQVLLTPGARPVWFRDDSYPTIRTANNVHGDSGYSSSVNDTVQRGGSVGCLFVKSCKPGSVAMRPTRARSCGLRVPCTYLRFLSTRQYTKCNSRERQHEVRATVAR
ncbi:hypothetical protein CA85_07590 [Allorhodopirellula solitaria]|uniref:Uncharacterized protein n=1 Tax=Allorhodopirellula solitaria TaxID=2527987 RepID=A0A5C5YDQ6_9BACT|nr:hypothetical protein CA85_07590 [Allorhodopirellula solitaria]